MRVKNCSLQIKAAGPQDGTDDGTFEAIVATYDLDSYGDKILPGAFEATLADWKAKGDPIPVIWSHMSYDPEAHIGVVEEAEERAEGLWVRGRLDLDQTKAAQVYRLMKGRRVTQFSFAYDVQEGAWVEQEGERPYYELRAMRLYEVGPCLVGVNQETELLAVKAADGRDLQLAVHGRTSPAEGDAIRVAVEAALATTTGAKAGRVLSAKNEETLRAALAKFSAGATDVKSVLAALSTDDDDEKSAPLADGRTTTTTTSKDDAEAKPSRSAVVEEPAGAKTNAPAAPRPASLRLRADLDALGAEVDTLT